MDLNREPPDNVEDWMRWVEARLRKVERHRHPRPGVVVLGDWTIHQSTNGDLVATHSSGSETVLAQP